MPPNASVLDAVLARARASAARRVPDAPDRLDAPEGTVTQVRSIAAGRAEVARARAKEAARLDAMYPRTQTDPIPPGLVCSARLP